MSTPTYAFLDEVWGGSGAVKGKKRAGNGLKQDPACSLYRKRNPKQIQPLDEVMSAYMEDVPYEKYAASTYNSQQRLRNREGNFVKTVDIHANQGQYDVADDTVFAESQEPVKPPPRRCFNSEAIDGIYSPNTQNAFEFDSYYKDITAQNNDHATDADGMHDQPCEEDVVADETVSTKPLTKEDVYKDMVFERYMNYLNEVNNTSSRAPRSGYLDLIMFVLAGILLIFMLEQIFQLGKYVAPAQ